MLTVYATTIIIAFEWGAITTESAVAVAVAVGNSAAEKLRLLCCCVLLSWFSEIAKTMYLIGWAGGAALLPN